MAATVCVRSLMVFDGCSEHTPTIFMKINSRTAAVNFYLDTKNLSHEK
jgi:hypothetical protein